jgi:glutamyl-tRNA synthetase
MEEMLELFDPAGINRSPSQYNIEKLNWINAVMLKDMDKASLQEALKPFGCDIEPVANKELLLNAALERAKTLMEVADTINSIIIAPVHYDEKAIEKNINDEAKATLKDFASELSRGTNVSTPDEAKKSIDTFLEKNNLKMPKLGLPLRIALVGTTTSPAINELICMVGAPECIDRIHKFLETH